MANAQNLVPQAHKLTVEEQSRGGQASGESRRKKRKMRETLEELLARDYHDRDGNVSDGTTVLMTKVFRMAMDGDMRAMEFVRDITGQKPVERIEVDSISPETRAEMEALFNADANADSLEAQG